MSIISEIFKESKDVENFSESVEVIKKIECKKNNKTQYKVSKRILKLKNNSILLVSKWIPKEKVYCNLCLKHARLTRINTHIIPINESDLCRCLLDPLGNEIIIRFKSLMSVMLFEQEMMKLNRQVSEIYNELSADVYVINEVNDVLGQFIVNINGTVNGEQIKKMAEERFSMPGLLSLRYSLEIQHRENIVSVIDDMPIFYLNEYLCDDTRPMFCTKSCKYTPSAPKKAITLIVLDPTNRERKNFKPDKKCRRTKDGIDVLYNIEDRWKGELVPTWLMRLLSDLYFYGRSFLGIFRISVKVIDMRSCYEHMLTKDDFLFEDNIHLKANVLKLFLMKIEDGLLKLPDQNSIEYLIDGIESSAKFIGNSLMVDRLMSMLQSVPRQRFVFLQHLLVVLQIIADSEETRMDAFNLGTTFSPAIFNTVQYLNIESTAKSLQLSVLTECMILLIDKIVDPDTHRQIVNAFLQYKSAPVTPCYTESPTVSLELESSIIDDYDEDQENRREQSFTERMTENQALNSINEEKSPKEILMGISSGNCLRERKYGRSSLDAERTVKRKSNAEKAVRLSIGKKWSERSCGTDSPRVVEENSGVLRSATRHVSLMGTGVSDLSRLQRRKLSTRTLAVVDNAQSDNSNVKRNNSRKLCSEPTESVKSNRSRSPYVKSMVAMYERRLKNSIRNVERSTSRKEEMKN